MKKFFKNFTLFFLIVILFLMLNNSSLVKDSVLFSFSLFKNNVFPNIFPFLVLSGLLINYGFINLCTFLFSGIMKTLFNISGASIFILIMSLLTGSPSNARYIKDLYEKNIISKNEAEKVLMFTHFASPLFIIGTISLFLNKMFALKILFAHYFSNAIIGFLFKKRISSSNYSFKLNKKSFGNCFYTSIKNAIDTLCIIFGTITIFLIITNLFNKFSNFSLYTNTIINGFLEMTQGLKRVSLLNISDISKAYIMTCFLSFGGISVHMQVLSIISDTDLRYYYFLFGRILQTVFSLILLYFIL